MTGFGKSVVHFQDKKISTEIRSLNSKQVDISSKLPPSYREKDLDIRNLVAKSLKRGKIDIAIYVESSGADSSYVLNEALFKAYHEKLKALHDEIGGNEPDYFSIISRFPDVLKSEKEQLDEAEWNAISQSVNEALEALNGFRQHEGEKINEDLKARVKNIEALLARVPEFEEERIERIKTRIDQNLQNLGGNAEVDADRFEQELIYYLEKLDISEEKQRLKTHCEHFSTIMGEATSQGKKLGFISQEIGREINTLGSKSNHAGMQQLVVEMKDELEKIKEQVLNVL